MIYKKPHSTKKTLEVNQGNATKRLHSDTQMKNILMQYEDK